jgi:hypothetical protein
MIIVTIELKSARGPEHDRTLGKITIANDGTGTEEVGNYRYELKHAGKFYGKKKGFFKAGKVRGFRRTLSPYRLVQRVLKDAGEL